LSRLDGILLLGLAIGLSGCANNALAPISQKSVQQRESATVHRAGRAAKPHNRITPKHYVVKRGDTLYSIAWRFGIDFRRLSKWNRITNPNLIFTGQKLKLNSPVKSKSTTGPKATRSKPVQRSKPRATRSAAKKSVSKRVTWTWPARGTVQRASSALGTKGIEILGKHGQPVVAASGGTVVYSGSGLRGYGQLIIVKHNEEFLSAYAHNDRLIVSEGAAVERGQKIAEMGNSGAKRVMLHFEIRRDGKAVEPLQYLPPR
jgi:lipoprotein NlpD